MDLEHEKRLTEVESRSKSNMKRLEEMGKWQDDLADLVGTVKVLADREARVEEDVGEIKSVVKELKEKPGKRWNSVIDKTITTIIALAIGYIAAKLGLGG